MANVAFAEQQRHGKPRRSLQRRSLPINVRSEMVTRSQGKYLCKRCRKIDLGAIFGKKHLTKIGNAVRKLGPTDEWSIDFCPLCELLLKTFGASENQHNYLRSFSSKRILYRGLKSVDMHMLSIGYPSSSPEFLVAQPKGDNTIRIIGPLVSFEVIQGWLNFCRDHHTRTCTSSENSTPVSSISSFKLIDCETRRIVPVTDQPYTTLSYVWGAGPTTPYSELLPKDLPNTIEDAIKVTRGLGFRYIWIDRFCINQQVQEDVAEQVPKMDLIYNNSELNIIAAAGKNPSYGLPGIQPRNPSQPRGKVGNYLLVSTMPDPVYSIRRSKWMTRAWTYQEGVLSRRRLIFTDEQAYFECSAMYCCEALNLPLPELHTQNQQQFKSCFCDGNNTNIFPRKLGRTGWEVVERIEEYSRRSLTKDSDILNGFMGILKALERSPQRLRHCLGVPILPSRLKPKGLEYSSADYVQEINSSKWSPTVGFCIGLCWYVEESSTRRKGFPSWSWTGWHGNIRWAFEEWQWRVIQGNTDMRVRVELQEGQVVTLEEFERAYDDQRPDTSSTLHIAAWTTPLHLLSRNKEHTKVLVKAADGRSLHWDCGSITEYPVFLPTRWMAIHLAQGPKEHAGVIVMVVYETTPGLYQRCGLGGMTNYNLMDPEDRMFRAWFENENLPELEKSWQEFRLC